MNRIKIPRRILSGIICVLVVWSLVGLGIVGAVVSTPIVEEPLGENSAQTIVGDEVVGLRTETSKTHYLGNSIYTVEAALCPVHYQDEGWQEIDNAWVPATAPWNWEMVQDSYHAYALNQFTYGEIMKFEIEGESVAFQPMELQWTNDLSMIQSISNPQNVLVEVTNEPTQLFSDTEGSIGSIRWNNAYGSGRHFEFTTAPGKLQTLLQLDAAPPKPLEYIFNGGNPVMRQSFIFAPSADLTIYVDSVLWDKNTEVQTVNDIEFRLNGEPVWYFWQARYWDSGNSTGIATTTLRKVGNDLWLDVLVPYEWLQTAVYPVYIDPDTGATLPGLGTTEDRDGKLSWTNTSKIQNELGNAATAFSSATYSDWLRASQFGFTIPVGSTIDGIVVQIHRAASITNQIKDSSLRLVNENGVNVGTDMASSAYYPYTTPSTETYGSSTFKWGTTPTPTMVNDSDFGTRLSTQCMTTGTRYAWVYWVKITVYYTLPEPPTVTTSACSDATASSLQANGEITDDGGLTVTRRGFGYAEGSKYSLDFNGVSDYVEIPYLADYYSNTVAVETFEWGIDETSLGVEPPLGDIDWTIVAAGDSKVEIDTAAGVPYAGTRCARFYRDGTNTPYADFAQTGGTGYDISIWVRKDDTSNLFVLHGDGTKAIYLQYTTAEALYYNGPDNTWHDTGETIDVETWALLELKNINWGTGKYDIYQNGVIAQSEADMRVTSAWADMVRFQNSYGTDSEAWLDNILIGSPSVWTFETWINRKADHATYERILSYSSGTTYDRFLQIQPNGTVLSGFTDTAGTNRYGITTATIPLNTDIRLSTTFDGTYIRIYFDGVLKATSASFAGKIPRNNNYPFQVGRLTTNYNFEGTEDDIRIWEDVRTQNEIQANMYVELNGDEAGLVGYWKLNEGTGIYTNLCQDATANPTNIANFPVANAVRTIDTDLYLISPSSVKINPNGASGDSYVYLESSGVSLGMEENKTYTAQARIYVPAATGLSPDDSRGLKIVFYTRETGGSYVRTDSAKANAVDEWVFLTVTFTVANNPDQAFIRLYDGFITVGKVVYWDKIQVEEGDTAHDWGYGTHGITYDSTSNENDGTISGADWVYQSWDLSVEFIDSSTYSSISDGFINKGSVTYNTAWTSTSGTVEDDIDDLDLGQFIVMGTYNIYRDYIFFDTSSIPTYAIIIYAEINLYGHAGYDYSDTDFDIIIQNGQPTYPHDPLVGGDYDKSQYLGNGGSFPTASFITDGYNTIILNVDGISWINKGGQTKFCMRSSRDISGTPPTGDEWVAVRAAEYVGTNCDPYLFVTYQTTKAVYEEGEFGEGEYSLTIEDLTSGTWYRVRGFAENSAGIGYGNIVVAQTITCSPDISNTPSIWNVNSGMPVGTSSEYSTGLAFFQITNNSGGAVDISIQGTDMTGGNTWTLSDTAAPGDMVYGLKAGLSGGDYTIIVKKNSPYNDLVTGLADSGTQEWGLRLSTPTVYSDGVSKSGIVTITATCV